MAKKLRGRDFMVFVGGKAVTMATSHSLNLTAQTDDTSSKDDGLASNPEVISTSWEAQTDALIPADEAPGDTFDELFDLFVAGDPVAVILGVPANHSDGEVPQAGWTVPGNTQVYYSGNAIISSLSRNDPNGQNATMSMTLTGKGVLTKHSS